MKPFLILAAVNGFLAVALGAFGAHGLKPKLSVNSFSAYETAVQYHFYHSLALLGVALLVDRLDHKDWLHTSGYLFTMGILLFSGSLYALALGAPKWLGPATPIGGLTLLAGWIALLIAALR